jgi:hypothetical protein
MFNCPFISATNLDDTNLLMVNIVHKWEVCAMLPRAKITCLNHVTSLFDKQDIMIQIFESCYIPVLTNKTMFQIFESCYIPV